AGSRNSCFLLYKNTPQQGQPKSGASLASKEGGRNDFAGQRRGPRGRFATQFKKLVVRRPGTECLNGSVPPAFNLTSADILDEHLPPAAAGRSASSARRR